MDKTIPGEFNRTVREHAGRVLFHFCREDWMTLTYESLSRSVRSIATSMMQRGFARNERAAIVSENRPEWCMAYLSIAQAGGVAVPIDIQLGPGEIRNLLNDADARLVFHSDKTAAQVQEAVTVLLKSGRKVATISFDSPEFREMEKTRPAGSFPLVSSDDLASIIYTSGTTGFPKGVMLTHNNFCSDVDAAIQVNIVSGNDNVLALLPLHHTYAFTCTFLLPLFLGASITYPASLKGPDLMAALRERGVSILVGVPQLLALINSGIMGKIQKLPRPLSFLLLKMHRFSRFLRRRTDMNLGRIIFKSAHRAMGSRFRFFTSGGARLDPDVMEGLEALGFTVLEGYGLTETSPMVTFNPVHMRKPGSAGRPFPSAELKVVSPSETGEGEVAIRGPMVMKGYYRNEKATAEVIKDGWFHTGDLGRIDSDGFLFITGRLKEVIVLSSGKNVYPEEVEQRYLASPLISEICVVGVEEKGVTEALHGVIVPDLDHARQRGISNIQDELRYAVSDLSASLPPFMRISGYTVHADPLPRTALGKLRRFMVKNLVRGRKNEGAEKKMEEERLFADDTDRAVAEAIHQFAPDISVIRHDDNLELDLGLDSLTKIELLVVLERRFSLSLPEHFMADVQTVDDLVTKVREQQAEGVTSGEIGKAGWKEILLREPAEDDLRRFSFGKGALEEAVTEAARLSVMLLFKILFRLESRGLENVPLQGTCIIAPNHTSYLDGFAVGLSLPKKNFENMYTLGLSRYFTGRFRQWFARLANVIPIDSSVYLNKALQLSAYVIRNDKSLMVFPEGGRSPDGTLMEFKKGVGILAWELGVPVIPVFINGAYEALPRTAVWPRPSKVKVVFGEPLRASDIDISRMPEGMDRYQYFAAQLQQRVAALNYGDKGR